MAGAVLTKIIMDTKYQEVIQAKQSHIKGFFSVVLFLFFFFLVQDNNILFKTCWKQQQGLIYLSLCGCFLSQVALKDINMRDLL